MNKLRRVTGTWHGTYSHDVLHPMPNLERVAFTLILRQGWFGRFTGTVTDNPDHGMPGTGIIEGHFSFPRITFIKRMPVCYVATPDGRRITLREYLIEQGYACEQDVPHMPVFYQGDFSSPSQALGTWIIRAGPVSLLNGKAVQMPEARGTWRMEKGDA